MSRRLQLTSVATVKPRKRVLVLLAGLTLLAAFGCGGTSPVTDSTIRPDVTPLPPEPPPPEPEAILESGAAFSVTSEVTLPLHLDVAADVLSAIADGPALFIFDKLFEGNGVVGDLILALLQGLRDDLRQQLQEQLQDDLDLADIEDKLRRIAARLRALGDGTLLSELRLDSELREDHAADATHSFEALLVTDGDKELRLTPKLLKSDATWSATTTVSFTPPDRIALGAHTLVLPLTEMAIAKVVLDVLNDTTEQSLSDLLSRVIDCTVISRKVSSWMGDNVSGLQAFGDTLEQSLGLGCRMAITTIPRLIHDAISQALVDGALRRNIGLSGTATLTFDVDGGVTGLAEGVWTKKLGTFSALRLADAVK